MDLSRFNFQLLISMIISGLSYLVGGIDTMFIYLCLVIALDYITGIIKAIYLKKLNSTIGLKGIMKKIGYIVAVSLCVVADHIINANGSIRILAISLLISCDGISIIENLSEIGIPIPTKVKEVLEQLRKEK